jgi:HEAT repeat protein
LTIGTTDLDAAIADLQSTDEARSESAATRLPSFGHQALKALLLLSTSPVADTRWWVVRALAGFAEPEARSALIGALADADVSVRQCAALSLREQPSPEALPALAAAMADDDPLVSRLAADAMAACGPPAVAYLDVALRSEHPRVRIEAARALAGLRDPSALPALYAALRDPTPLVEHWASQGLEALGQGMVYFKE